MKRFLTMSLLVSVGGCSVGPHDLDPHVALPPAPAPIVVTPTGGPRQATEAAALPAEWWHAFGNAPLDALVAEALAHNEDVAAAEATLRQTQEQARATRGSALPQVDANYQAERTRVSNALSPAVSDPNQQLYTLHTAQVNVSYELDLFGATRSRIRSARAAATVQARKLDAARAMVVANLVAAVIERASLADQIAAARTSVAVNRDILTAITRRQQLGDAGAADVATQATALATAEGALPPLIRAEAHQRVVIGTLIGRAAGTDLPPLPDLTSLTLPGALPSVIPSDLVARRPDVLAARAQMEGAGADLGTAIAARLPGIQLSASAGGAAEKFGDMFAGGNPFWTLIGGITQPIFHGGALRHQQHAAEAALDVAKAQYRAAVLQAFGDVADALAGLQTDGDSLSAATRAADAASRALTFARRQLALGSVGTLQLLNATAADATARGQLVQARAARLTDTVALFQAAGGAIAKDS